MPMNNTNLRARLVLVAGATGLAGNAVLQQLLVLFPRARLRGTWRTVPPYLQDPRIEYVRADLTRQEDCLRVANGCDAAILAAAVTGGARSAQSEPHRQVTDNLVMDALLFEALHQSGVRRAVYLSTATVYQDSNGCLREDELDWNLDPPLVYFGVGWAKRAAEKLCRFWHARHGMQILIARCANLY